MSEISNGSYMERPNQLVMDKGDSYYRAYAAWIMYRSNCSELTKFRLFDRICWQFYMGNSFNKFQWQYFDDIANFLNDSSGQAKFRENWIDNICMPLVRMYIGNALKTPYTHTLKNVSGAAVQRRNSKLNSRLFMEQSARHVGGDIETMLRQNMPVGNNSYETEMIFNGEHKDSIIEGTNDIITGVSEMNELDSATKKWIAESLAVSGLSVILDQCIGGHQIFKPLVSSHCIYDVAALRPDLQDGSYFGHIDVVDPMNIFEANPNLSEGDKDKIMQWSKNSLNSSMSVNNMYFTNIGGKVNQVNAEWRDCEFGQFAVADISGIEQWVKIGDGADEFKLNEIKKLKDIESTYYQEKLGDDSTIKTWQQVIRQIEFVDGSGVPMMGSIGVPGENVVVLKTGVKKYPEVDPYAVGTQRFSYKAGTFKYYRGIPYSPVSLIIDAQRIVNRIESAKEQQLNSSRPPSTFYDELMPTEKDGAFRIENTLINGGIAPARLRGGAQNAVREVPGTTLEGIGYLDSYRSGVKRDAQLSTGSNETIMGAGTQELVRNTMIQAQAGSVIQEDFYHSLGDMLKQCVQSIATRGSRIYRDNPTALMAMIRSREVYDDFMNEEFMNETVYVGIKRSESRVTEIEKGNALLLQLVQMQLINPAIMGGLVNKSTTDDVWMAFSRFVHDKAISESELMQQEQVKQNQLEAQQQLTQTQGNLMQIDAVDKAHEGRIHAADQNAKSKMFDSMMRSATELEKAKIDHHSNLLKQNEQATTA